MRPAANAEPRRPEGLARWAFRAEGFSFLEVLIGVIILAFGLVPLLWNLLQATGHTKVTVRQVQATNHAANLLEALRAVPFKDLSRFPPCMVQIEGGDNVWRKPGETPEVSFSMQEAYLAPGKEAQNVFQGFVNDFFKGDAAIVPALEAWFRRYFILLRDDETKPVYLTLIVRMEWQSLSPLDHEKPERTKRFVELRTVVADPYAFGSSGGGGGPDGDRGPDETGGVPPDEAVESPDGEDEGPGRPPRRPPRHGRGPRPGHPPGPPPRGGRPPGPPPPGERPAQPGSSDAKAPDAAGGEVPEDE